jgi:hypothetical protein
MVLLSSSSSLHKQVQGKALPAGRPSRAPITRCGHGHLVANPAISESRLGLAATLTSSGHSDIYPTLVHILKADRDDMRFEFIDNSTVIDRTSRRQIRSHVAKGRNAGRKLNRPSRRTRNFQPLRKTAPTQPEIQDIPHVLAQPQTGAITSSLTQRALTCLPPHWQQDAASGGVSLISRGKHADPPVYLSSSLVRSQP